MVVNYLDPIKETKILNSEILANRFRSLLFIVCIKKRYADSFINEGAIKFSKPSEWIPDGTSRGDELEGVYASRGKSDEKMKEILAGIRDRPVEFVKDDIVFYKSEQICNCRAYCMYSLFDTSLRKNKKRSQDHRFHESGTVSRVYFRELFPKWDEKEYYQTEDDDKPVVLIIQPKKFIERVMASIHSLGVRDDEILFQPIQYFNYYESPFLINPPIMELFYKDASIHSHQHEVRIVIDTSRSEIRQLFDHNNGIIKLGALDESIATVSEFYFDDLYVEVRDDKLLYSLARPKELKDSRSYVLSFICRALSDELTGSPMSIEEIEREIKDKEGRIQFYGMRYDKETHTVEYDGKIIDFSITAGGKLLDHYNIYKEEKNLSGMKDTIMKLQHFFPIFEAGKYLGSEYDALIKNCNSPS